MMMKKETVKLTIQVPKGVIDFLMDLFALGGSQDSVPEFIQEEVTKIPETIMSGLSNIWFDTDYIRKKYHLGEDA